MNNLPIRAPAHAVTAPRKAGEVAAAGGEPARPGAFPFFSFASSFHRRR